jgi:hypothetical protein
MERKTDMRTTQLKAIALAAGTALALTACQNVQPVYNVKDAQVVPSSAKSLQAAQVRAAIITAGTSLGWRVADSGPGRLEGTLKLREHTAVVEIPYSATAYSITFKSGDKLKAADGSIHKNYNGWIQNLDRAIRTEVSRL